MDSTETHENAAERIASHLLRDTAITSRGSGRIGETPEPPASLIQALIIGIDVYQSDSIPNLEGAVADADDMARYLHFELNVPERQIANLRNAGATRRAIIDHIRALASRRRFTHSDGPVPVEKGDPFLIYYAGHGTSAKAPDGWATENDKISMVVPYDGSASGDEGSVVATRNIPDRTIGALLHELAEGTSGEEDGGVGDNITVIFDCCYSGSGTRHPELLAERLERGFELNRGVVIPSSLDEEIWGRVYVDRTSDAPSGFVHSGTRSHVLLAACAESEKAYEGLRRGVFTQVLLKELRKVKIDKITYQTLMRRIEVPLQTPQCEGYNSHRLLFNALSASNGRVVYEVTQTSGQYCLHAGSLDGVTKGATFSIYPTRDFDISDRPLLTMVANGVHAFNTDLACAPGEALSELPYSPCFAFQIAMGEAEALRLHISPLDEPGPVIRALAEEIELYRKANSHVILLGDESQAHLSVRNSPDGIEFIICDTSITTYGLDKLSQRVPSDHLRIQTVLRDAARFFWHLHRAPDKHLLRDRIPVSVHRVRLDESGELDITLRRPYTADGDGVNYPAAVEVEADNKTPYGMTVRNGFDSPLYVWAFYFDCSDLSIAVYYKPPDFDPKARGDASLPPNKQLPIGHGSGGSRPFKYHMEEISGELDVGFIKLFVSTERFDLDAMEQPSPFLSKTPRTSKFVDIPVTAIWDTIMIPIVQRRPVASA